MRNVPGLPGGGVLFPQTRRDALNHMRFRPRVWAELAAADWRLRTRLTDEVRWNVAPDGTAYSFPDELVLDNLFLEGTDLFDGRLDVRIGRQDLYNFCGLDHVFVDGTPGDGSRTLFADMVKLGFSFENEARLDLFFLHCGDENALRWGTARSRRRSLAGLGGGADPDMDDWGWGAVWSGRAAGLPYQVFALQKVTESFRRDGREHPWTRRELAGVKLTPQITDDLSLQLEAMGQIGRNGDGDWLSGWSTYSGLSWRRAGEGAVTPFMRAGFHTMSGARDAADEDGGHRAWDPMWSRGVNDSELFLYGTHYGVGWWSNMMFLKFAAGAELGAGHRVTASTGPMFAAVDDGLGGGDGHYKGLLSQARYDFPLWPTGADEGGRFRMFGHVIAELFNPGDYFETSKPGWFVRWQVDFAF